MSARCPAPSSFPLRPALALVALLLCTATVARAQGDLAGFPKFHTNNQLGAPLFFDLDGDGVDELLHANGDHTIDIWTAGGAAFPGWPVAAGWHTWNMTPSVGDLDGDGSLEVVTATSGNRVYAYHSDGTPVAGFPRSLGGEICGACCLGDLDGDGDMEIIVQPRDTTVHALQGDGTDLPGWPVTIPLKDGGSQTAAVTDLDGDGRNEVIFTSQGIPSTLFVYRGDGTTFPGFPVTVTYTVGSPAVADLDRDGDLEIIYTVGSDLAARHHDGSMVSGFKVDCGTWTLYTSVAVGDIDRDGYPEIVFGSQNDNVYVVRHDGTFQPGWPSPPTTGTVHATPALADLDGDGDLEIVVAAPTSGSGMIYAWHHDQSDVAGFPWARPSTFYGGAALGDIDGDNRLDFAASGRSGSALYAWSTPFAFDARRIVHGAYRVNRHNNALHNHHPRDGQAGISLTVPAATTTGSTISIGVEGGNRSQSGQTLFGLLQAETPAGVRFNLIGPLPATLPPGGSFSFPYSLRIPAAAPSGGYRIIGVLANGNARIVHHDCELLTVY